MTFLALLGSAILAHAAGVFAPPMSVSGGITRTSYNALKKVETETDALGRVTRWEYDVLGRTTKRTLPGAQFETFEYDLVVPRPNVR